jgi:molybdopterin/thiamine biosynthesis adenylyltransferase
MKIIVYGLGAIGSNLLVQLAKQYPSFEFIGVDYDRIEDRNIRTQAYFLEHVGLPKTQAMRIILGRYLRKPLYTPLHQKVEAGYKVSDADLAIDCFDNTASRKLLKELYAKSKTPLLHVGFSPQYSAECIWDQDYDVPNDVDPAAADICSMAEAVGFIHYTVNAVVLNLAQWLTTKDQRSFILTGKTRIQWL